MTTVSRTGARWIPPRGAVAGFAPNRAWIESAQRGVAVLAAFLVGLRFVVHGGVDLADGLAVVLAAVWLRNLRRYQGAWALLIIGMIAIVWGWLLGDVAVSDGYALSASDRLQTAAEFGSVLVGIGILLWARTVISTPLLGAAVGFGLVVNAELFGDHAADMRKYTWGFPITVTVLSLAMFGRRVVVCVATIGLAVLAISFGDRSFSAALLLTLLLYLATTRRARSAREIPTPLVASFILAVAGVVFWLGQTLLVAGFLGKGVQTRSIAQIRASGNLLLGGRPEMAATWALFWHRPVGYGAGTVPQGKDILVALQELRKASPNIDFDYVTSYLFGGHIELHSVTGDLWASFGLAGLAFVVLTAVLTLTGVAVCVSRRSGNALALLVGIWTLWNLGCSPFLSSMPALILGVALILPLRRSRTDPAGDEDDVQPVNTAERRARPESSAAPSEHGVSPRSAADAIT